MSTFLSVSTLLTQYNFPSDRTTPPPELSNDFWGVFFLAYMGFICIAVVVGLAFYIFTGLMIADAASRDIKVLPNKKHWILAMYFTSAVSLNWVIAIIYYFTRKRVMDRMS